MMQRLEKSHGPVDSSLLLRRLFVTTRWCYTDCAVSGLVGSVAVKFSCISTCALRLPESPVFKGFGAGVIS
jgi:hypothetical protein